MTQPVQEPLVTRSIGYGQWRTNQLERRPAPTPPTGGELITAESSTDWGTSLTTLVFTELVSQYDQVTPTFSMPFPAGGNLSISKNGLYVLSLGSRSNVSQVNVDTVEEWFISSISGETPRALAPSFSTGRTSQMIRRLNHTDLGASDTFQFLWPRYTEFLWYDADAFDAGTAGPSEIRVQVVKKEDNVGVAEVQPIVSLLCARIAPAGDW